MNISLRPPVLNFEQSLTGFINCQPDFYLAFFVPSTGLHVCFKLFPK